MLHVVCFDQLLQPIDWIVEFNVPPSPFTFKRAFLIIQCRIGQILLYIVLVLEVSLFISFHTTERWIYSHIFRTVMTLLISPALGNHALSGIFMKPITVCIFGSFTFSCCTKDLTWEICRNRSYELMWQWFTKTWIFLPKVRQQYA